MRIWSGFIAITLLLLLFLQANSTLINLWTECSNWHEIIEQKIATATLNFETLTMSSATYHQLRWEKEGKEFWYQGEMYDVVSIEQGEGFIKIKAHKDEFEKKLIQRLLANFDRIDYSNGHAPVKVPFVLYTYLPTSFEWNGNHFDINYTTFPIYQESKPVFLNFPPISPPPESIAS